MKSPFTLATALVALILVSSAQAASITGSINFASDSGGGVTLQDSLGITTTNFPAAKGVKSWSLAKTTSSNGSFLSVPNGQSVSFNTTPWVFNPSTPIAPLWSIPSGNNFSFSLASSLVVVHTSTFLVVSGTGILSGSGFDDTPARWFFTTHTQPVNGQYVWSSSTVAIPEAGTTSILGAALCGLCLVRRRKSS